MKYALLPKQYKLIIAKMWPSNFWFLASIFYRSSGATESAFNLNTDYINYH